jgi:hypothetical protein
MPSPAAAKLAHILSEAGPELAAAKGGRAGADTANLAMKARCQPQKPSCAATRGVHRAALVVRAAQHSPAADLRFRGASRPFPSCAVPLSASAPDHSQERTTKQLLEPLP